MHLSLLCHPSPCFFFCLSHLWAVVWGDGRLEGLSPGPGPSQEGGPPQLSIRPAREGGHFLFLHPLSVCCFTASLAASPNAPGSPAPKAPWTRLLAPSCQGGRLSEAQAFRGSQVVAQIGTEPFLHKMKSPNPTKGVCVCPRHCWDPALPSASCGFHKRRRA